jgi:hypothetical protein
MAHSEPNAGQDADSPEITNLSPRGSQDGETATARPGHGRRVWDRVSVGLVLVLLVGVLLRSVLATGAPGGSTARIARPVAAVEPTETASLALLPTPAPPLTAPTPLPGVAGTPALGPAPASCGTDSPALTPGGPPWTGNVVGQAPVLLGGFVGPYATMPLGPAASAMAYTWAAPYTSYGWPAPIGPIVRNNIRPGPVTLSGWDVRTGYPLWFGFITAGEWGAPARVSPAYTLDPENPPVLVGGWTNEEWFWYGYAFLPGAGCYILAADWPGGSWRVTVSAGATSVPAP